MGNESSKARKQRQDKKTLVQVVKSSYATASKAVQFHDTPATTATTVAAASPSSGKHNLLVTGRLSHVRDTYHMSPQEIGHGHYGIVRKCRHRETGEWCAIKSIQKSKLSNTKVLEREVHVLQALHHTHVLELKQIFEDEHYLHFVTELCKGGELFDEILKREHFSEVDAAQLMRDVLSAIRYCHDEKQICHRDLKPENFLFLNPDGTHIKIIDFGLSRFDLDGEIMKTKVGTPYYVAPEVLRRRYTKACDMWSLGVITYILLCGYPPFYGDSDAEIFKSVSAGYYCFPQPEWNDISDEAKDFVNNLLQMDPSKRMTAAQALEHEWITKYNNETKPKPESSSQRAQPQQKRNSVKSEKYQRDRALQKLKKATYAYLQKNKQHADSNASTSSDENNSEDEKRIKSAFDHFVTSDSKGLSVDNVKDILRDSVQAKELMDLVDTNHDGRISFDEFYQAIVQKE